MEMRCPHALVLRTPTECTHPAEHAARGPHIRAKAVLTPLAGDIAAWTLGAHAYAQDSRQSKIYLDFVRLNNGQGITASSSPTKVVLRQRDVSTFFQQREIFARQLARCVVAILQERIVATESGEPDSELVFAYRNFSSGPTGQETWRSVSVAAEFR